MKKSTLIITLIVSSFLMLNAQITPPNAGFEDWSMLMLYNEPDSFITTNMQSYMAIGQGNVTKISDAHSGDYALKMESMQYGSASFPGGVFVGSPGEDIVGGGIPYSGVPDSIEFWAKYSINPNDTAMMLTYFSMFGFPLAYSVKYITGTESNYVKIQEPITWLSWGIPDSVTVAFLSSGMESSTAAGSFLCIDDLSFTGTNQQIPDGGFENWTEVSYEEPDHWSTSNLFTYTAGGLSASKTSEAYQGMYSLMLETQSAVTGDDLSWLTNGEILDYNQVGGMPVSVRPGAVSFYYKSMPQGQDSAMVGVIQTYYDNTQDSTIILEEMFATLPPANTWTYYELALNQYTMAADTLNIAFSSSRVEEPIGQVTVGSQLYIDQVEVLSAIGVDDIIDDPESFLTVSPNPATDNTNIWLPKTISSDFDIVVYDVRGKVIDRYVDVQNQESFYLNTSAFPAGMYFIKVISAQNSFSGAFQKR